MQLLPNDLDTHTCQEASASTPWDCNFLFLLGVVFIVPKQKPKGCFFHGAGIWNFLLCLVVVEVSAIPQALTDDHFSLAAVFFSFSDLSGGP